MDYLNISNNCRACQIKTQEESQIFIFATNNLPSIYQETTSLDIQENDGLPKVLCSTCYDRLLEAYNFRKMCSAAVLYFRKILSMDVPEEKYTPPMHIKTETDLDAPSSPQSRDLNCPLDKEDSLSGISDTLSIDDKLPEILKTDPGDDATLTSSTNQAKQEKTEKDPEPQNPISLILQEKQEDCGICGAKFAADELESHMSTHKKDNVWCCEFCTYRSRKKDCLQQHVDGAHNGKNDFFCQHCGRCFVSAIGLKQHIRRIKGIKKFKCKICGIKKISSTELKNHENIHARGRIFYCKFCPQKTTYKTHMKQHVKSVHQRIRNFHCPHCEKSFGTSDSLQNHLMTHTGQKPYACNECGKRFILVEHLRSHMKTHIKSDSKSKIKQTSETQSAEMSETESAKESKSESKT
ncbi:zinc finger protein OZF-like [Phlebotomus papatasi]|uniref:zinc finger protein OZF-like n=1 Tax=Phlebotomus papatasi TaxID=29031 RepID=UPI0024841FC3|nr:zinc finger protein OZF-like [Phlebotomus papatasi]